MYCQKYMYIMYHHLFQTCLLITPGDVHHCQQRKQQFHDYTSIIYEAQKFRQLLSWHSLPHIWQITHKSLLRQAGYCISWTSWDEQECIGLQTWWHLMLLSQACLVLLAQVTLILEMCFKGLIFTFQALFIWASLHVVAHACHALSLLACDSLLASSTARFLQSFIHSWFGRFLDRFKSSL